MGVGLERSPAMREEVAHSFLFDQSHHGEQNTSPEVISFHSYNTLAKINTLFIYLLFFLMFIYL